MREKGPQKQSKNTGPFDHCKAPPKLLSLYNLNVVHVMVRHRLYLRDNNAPTPVGKSDMTSKIDKKREDLKERLITAAETAIAEGGLRSLKARDVTAKAGCALGGLYNAVTDLDELVMLVNTRTLTRLGKDLQDAVPQNTSPTDVMQALAETYVDFALNNQFLWSAIFNHRLPANAEVPTWHAAKYPILIAEIIDPLSKLRPDLAPDALRLRAQTLFAAVHGVVQLAIYGRFVGVPFSVLKAEVAALVEAMTRGIHLIRT